MTAVWLALVSVLGLLVWTLAALVEMGTAPAFARWLKLPGNGVRVTVWVGALAVVVATWLAREGSWLASLRTEAVSIAVTVIVIEELQRIRTQREWKLSVIRQMASQSNDFALDALRLAREMGWHNDGSLRGANLTWANLQGADLSGADLQSIVAWRANLRDADLWGAKLRGANLEAADLQCADLVAADLQGANFAAANLQGALLVNANLRDADLAGANLAGVVIEDTIPLVFKWDARTVWPRTFNPNAAGLAFANEEHDDSQRRVVAVQ